MTENTKMVTLIIDGKKVEVPHGTSIMNAAELLGIKVPRLCYHPKLSVEGACRVCIVEVKGARNFIASCATPVAEGMEVTTTSPEIRQARRDIVELILDNHPKDCQTCERDGNCELQRLAYAMGVRNRYFEGEKKNYEKDLSGAAVVRDPNKCILCQRCVRVCEEVQGVTCLSQAHRGFKTVVMPAFDLPFAESVCTGCGQCINVCPTAAFLEKDSTKQVWKALADPELTVIAQFAPSVRAAIGEGFGLPPGRNMQGEVITALKLVGCDIVFDTTFGADLTIVEEANEFVQRLTKGGTLPMITSCSAAWMKYVEQFHPTILDHISTCKSPMSMVSAMTKSFYAQKQNIDPAKIFNLAVMCCTAKKYEAARPEMCDEHGRPYTDTVITTREFVWMLKSLGIDLPNLEKSEPDPVLGFATGAADIFGATGGVMEAALRTAYEIVTGETLIDINFNAVRGMKGIKEANVNVSGTEVKVAVAHGLGNARQLMRQVEDGTSPYHFIEIMGCPGGCIGGGGQPYAGTNVMPLDQNMLEARARALYNIDEHKVLRKSHENPYVQRLYKEFLGKPLSEVSHKYLHTHYKQHFPVGI
ncbi:MAG: ferredoxin [Candidatus Auribacter fodinae]|jgi:iron-only hydrogenase group A|uniref:Ferredoxin n=1 Tax=Candidatus Auribacter fodinae TaxID=2093366 RepID=A0A3A4QXW4_9BACT|nr:MAG: ferredoxin [Candidatus Auribacter fodinae]